MSRPCYQSSTLQNLLTYPSTLYDFADLPLAQGLPIQQPPEAFSMATCTTDRYLFFLLSAKMRPEKPKLHEKKKSSEMVEHEKLRNRRQPQCSTTTAKGKLLRIDDIEQMQPSAVEKDRSATERKMRSARGANFRVCEQQKGCFSRIRRLGHSSAAHRGDSIPCMCSIAEAIQRCSGLFCLDIFSLLGTR